jgi:hypothetical protein
LPSNLLPGPGSSPTTSRGYSDTGILVRMDLTSMWVTTVLLPLLLSCQEVRRRLGLRGEEVTEARVGVGLTVGRGWGLPPYSKALVIS